MIIYKFFSELDRPEEPENTNGGNYRYYLDLVDDNNGNYYSRIYSSYHGDIEPMPEYDPIDKKTFEFLLLLSNISDLYIGYTKTRF